MSAVAEGGHSSTGARTSVSEDTVERRGQMEDEAGGCSLDGSFQQLVVSSMFQNVRMQDCRLLVSTEHRIPFLMLRAHCDGRIAYRKCLLLQLKKDCDAVSVKCGCSG